MGHLRDLDFEDFEKILDPESNDASDGSAIGLGVVGAQVVKGVLDIVGKVIEGAFRLGEGVATGNTDVIATAAVVATALATYIFFLTTKPYSTILKRLKLDGLYSVLLNGMVTLLQGQPGAVGQLTGSISSQAQACINKFQSAGLTVPPKYYQLRDSANAATTLDQFDHSFIGQLLGWAVPTLTISNAVSNFITGGDTGKQQAEFAMAIQAQCAIDLANAPSAFSTSAGSNTTGGSSPGPGWIGPFTTPAGASIAAISRSKPGTTTVNFQESPKGSGKWWGLPVT